MAAAVTPRWLPQLVKIVVVASVNGCGNYFKTFLQNVIFLI